MSEDRKVAIITGSSQGLGASIAIKLSQRNINLVINYSNNKDMALKIKDECVNNGVEAITVQADVSSDDDCKKLVQETIDTFGKVDILVNNAGTTKFADHSKLDKLNDEDFINIYKVNVIGPYQMIRAVEPIMKENGFGSVVNISSIAGKTGIGSSIAYAASKGALNTMTLSLAKALGPEIRVNTVCPGFIGTGWLPGEPTTSPRFPGQLLRMRLVAQQGSPGPCRASPQSSLNEVGWRGSQGTPQGSLA